MRSNRQALAAVEQNLYGESRRRGVSTYDVLLALGKSNPASSSSHSVPSPSLHLGTSVLQPNTSSSAVAASTSSASVLPPACAVNVSAGHCDDDDFPIPDAPIDGDDSDGHHAVAAVSCMPLSAADSSDGNIHDAASLFESDGEFESDRTRRGRRQRVRPTHIRRVVPPGNTRPAHAHARDDDELSDDAEQPIAVVEPAALPVFEVRDSGDDDDEDNEVVGIRLPDHGSDVDGSDVDDVDDAAGQPPMAAAAVPVAHVPVPAASPITDEAVKSSHSLGHFFSSLPAATAVILLPIILPFFHRLNAPIGTARWIWAWLYNSPTILSYLVTCLYASSSDYTQGLFARILAMLNTYMGTILVAMKLPTTIPALIKSNRWLAAFCSVDPMVMCPNCCTLHGHASDCVVMVDGRPTSKVCQHIEYPRHPQQSARQACNTALLSVIKTKSTHKGDVTTLAPHPQNHFIYLGANSINSM